ncbi:hypothetical protein V0288_20665 [Pannus brasiliensis CCIBt3594]|uniref:Uncharacterized protein n=1 Tax=Pannus brasiliensis CCIBt3594 TaxID=1427578 RepID=A0AAW9R038_9CHRO
MSILKNSFLQLSLFYRYRVGSCEKQSQKPLSGKEFTGVNPL